MQNIWFVIFITLVVAAVFGWWLEERKKAASASPKLRQLRQELASAKRELGTIRLKGRDESAQSCLEDKIAVLRSEINTLEKNPSPEEVTSTQPSKAATS